MGTAERRDEIIKLLCRRRHETIPNLAFEFGVSERTIRRDIEAVTVIRFLPNPADMGAVCMLWMGIR